MIRWNESQSQRRKANPQYRHYMIRAVIITSIVFASPLLLISLIRWIAGQHRWFEKWDVIAIVGSAACATMARLLLELCDRTVIIRDNYVRLSHPASRITRRFDRVGVELVSPGVARVRFI